LRTADRRSGARHFFKRLLKELRYKPRRLITDGLRSYGVARREILPEVGSRHRTGRKARFACCCTSRST
jgi:putative transposase